MLKHPYPDDLAFSKQFLISTNPIHVQPVCSWFMIRVLDYYIYCHPHLPVIEAKSEQKRVILLGTLLDPESPNATDQGILKRLLLQSSDFTEFECASYMLAGRYILIPVLNGDMRIYPDAAGLKSIYYMRGSDQRFFSASTPALLSAVGLTERDDSFVRDFECYRNSGSWPVHVIPYRGVEQNLPNHYLDFFRRESVRFWPKTFLPSYDMEEVAPRMLSILHGTITAALCRRPIIMSLTGGYDSRVLAAAAKKHWDNVRFFTIVRRDMPRNDLSIPKQIRRAYGLNHQFVDPENYGRDTDSHKRQLKDLLLKNVGGMYYDNSINTVYALAHTVGQDVLLPGILSEVHRCFYYKLDDFAAALDPATLSRLSGFQSPVAKFGLEAWRSTIPNDSNVAMLDLLYWEQRLGVWASTGLTFREAVIDVLPPMNSRAYLELGLCTDVSSRIHPHLLLKRIIELSDPTLSQIPFNWDYRDGILNFARTLPIPWRVKKIIGIV